MSEMLSISVWFLQEGGFILSEQKSSVWIQAIPGLILLFIISAFARGTADFGLPQWKGLEGILKGLPVMLYGKNLFTDILHLNFILLVIIIGMLIRNTIGIPQWAASGVKLSRLFIKMGVILLGSLYSLKDLLTLGTVSVSLILLFVMGTALFVMWLGKRMKMDPASSAVLAAGCGVCGVSAIVATAPAVKAKTSDVAYSIATILAFGVACLFIFPLVGHAIGLTDHQFGAWAGTGILNSGQVLAAALAFDPSPTSQSLKTGEIFNLTRVVFLPFVVLVLACIHTRMAGEVCEDGTVQKQGLLQKFPMFVLGFLAMVFLTSFGAFGSTSPPSNALMIIRDLYMWFFSIGLTGLGMQISISEMKKAGGTPLVIGVTAGALKAIGALIVVKLFIPPNPPM